MTKIALTLAAAATTVLSLLCTAPAHAFDPIRTWVSATGSNSNTSSECSLASAPCVDFATALSQTTPGGEINCIGPVGDIAGSGSVTITISVTVDCHGAFGGYVTSFPNAFVVNAPGQVVALRNLNIDGHSGSGGVVGGTGVLIQAAAAVYIEDCVIENFSQTGISDTRTGGGTQLFIRNTVIRNNTGAGIVAAAAATNSVVLENVQSVGNKFGVAAASGNHVVISRSVMSGNSVAGVEADPGAQVSVDNTEITHNIVVGVQAYGTITLANSDISYNSAAISGATTSYGNNRIFGNPESSTAPTPIGAASADFGQM